MRINILAPVPVCARRGTTGAGLRPSITVSPPYRQAQDCNGSLPWKYPGIYYILPTNVYRQMLAWIERLAFCKANVRYQGKSHVRNTGL